MRASTIVNSALLITGSFVVASWHQDITPTAIAIDKRQIGTGGGNGPPIDLDRPAEWDDLPPLPDDVKEAYEQQVEFESLALLNSWWDNNLLQTVPFALSVRFTYLSELRILEILERVMPADIAPNRRKAAITALMEQKLGELDIQVLEQQMQQIVQFRQQNENFGSPGQERWRYTEYRKDGDPFGLLSPFEFMVQGQTRLLIITKARNGTVKRRKLMRYLMDQNPFLSRKQAAEYIKSTFSDFKFRQ